MAGRWHLGEDTESPGKRGKEEGRPTPGTKSRLHGQPEREDHEKGGPDGSIGFDGGKLTKGRKRHIVVDSLGFLLVVLVTAANVADCVAAKDVLRKARSFSWRLRLFWADGAYKKNPLIQWARRTCRFLLAIVNKMKGQQGFQLLPHRWVVERTFAWLGNYRRLAKDYEYRTQSSEAFIRIAAIHLTLRRC